MIDTEQKKEVSINDIKTSIPLIDKTQKNTRNMPAIIFIENVEDFSEKYGHDQLVEEVNVYFR